MSVWVAGNLAPLDMLHGTTTKLRNKSKSMITFYIVNSDNIAMHAMLF